MKKILLITAALTLALGASSLMAQASSWTGTFNGDMSGTWQGTLNPAVDPSFSGTWEKYSPVDPPPHGYLRGEIVGLTGRYYQVDGTILDDANNVIGEWSGLFPAYDDALAYGKWALESGENGRWSGWSN